MSKLDPKLELLLKKKDQENQPRRIVRAQSEGEEPPQIVRILIKFTGDLSELQALGFQSRAVAGNIASGEVSLDDLPAIAALDTVIKIEMSRPMYPMLDNSVPSIKADVLHTANPAYKGTGVIVGVVDASIDFTHPCFRNADGSSRILFLWDQSPLVSAQGTPPAPFGYGIEYDKAAIDAALSQIFPFQTIEHKDTDSHGTHVTSIAAGNGSVADRCRLAGTFVGVAPEADLIFVAFDNSQQAEVGESARLTEALQYIFDKAASLNKPAVINMSIGNFIGPHDGTSLVEKFIDNLLTTPGRATVNAGGNAANDKLHAYGAITSFNGYSAEVQFQVEFRHKLTLTIDLWYKGEDRFDVSVTPPGNQTSPVVTAGDPILAFHSLENGNILTIKSQLNDQANHDNRIYIDISRGDRLYVEAGTWTLNLQATAVNTGEFHCWLDEPGNKIRAHFLSPYVSEGYSLGVPATSKKTITVGAYSDRLFTVGKLAKFSSRGPTRDERIKPEIVAPGSLIVSARSSRMTLKEGDIPCYLFCCNKYAAFSGTSMAAPHVTGVIALMLQKNPTLSIDQIRTYLFGHTQTNAEMGTLPNSSWGYGIVEAEAVLAVVPTAAGSQPSSNPSTSPASNLGGAAPIMPLSFNLLARIESEILQTPTGQHYAYLVQKHFEELRTLVNTNRRVGTVWVRAGGPSIVRHLLQALYTPDEPVPSVINGKSLVESVNRFLAVLRRYGSPALRADLDRYSQVILQFEGLSYNQFLAQLR